MKQHHKKRPAEIQKELIEEFQRQRSTLLELKIIVLGDDAVDYSDTAFLAGVRKLVATAKEYEDYLDDLNFGDMIEL